MNRTLFLFIVIMIEGYVVLSTELLAIRQTLPYVGNGTDTVSIIIAAVLMPLAFGYYYGGRFRPVRKNGRVLSVRNKLTNNIIIAAAILLPGLSFFLLNFFFLGLWKLGVAHRLVTTALYSVLFLVTPVYCLGQTVPIISNYFSSEALSRITGKMLFFSTLGSFLGAVFSTLVLMSFFGVHNTVRIVFILLTILVFMLSKKKLAAKPFLMIAIAFVACYLNSGAVMHTLNVVGDNQYDTIEVLTDAHGTRRFYQNGNSSSLITLDGHVHPYAEFINRHYINPIKTGNTPPKSILIIGAGGFTLGLEDEKDDYTYVDIDPSLKELSETYFLQRKLGKNKHFVPEDVRAYLNHPGRKFDLIIMDAYFGDLTIPEYLVTQEYFEKVKASVNENGIILANFIVSPGFEGRLSQNLDNTLHSVFPHLGREVICDEKHQFNGWEQDENIRYNVIYSYHNLPADSVHTIYTDDKNAVSFDKPQKQR